MHDIWAGSCVVGRTARQVLSHFCHTPWYVTHLLVPKYTSVLPPETPHPLLTAAPIQTPPAGNLHLESIDLSGCRYLATFSSSSPCLHHLVAASCGRLHTLTLASRQVRTLLLPNCSQLTNVHVAPAGSAAAAQVPAAAVAGAGPVAAGSHAGRLEHAGGGSGAGASSGSNGGGGGGRRSVAGRPRLDTKGCPRLSAAARGVLQAAMAQ